MSRALRHGLHDALDAAGVDYWCADQCTFWACGDGREFVAYEYDTQDGQRLAVKVFGVTDPAQVLRMAMEA